MVHWGLEGARDQWRLHNFLVVDHGRSPVVGRIPVVVVGRNVGLGHIVLEEPHNHPEGLEVEESHSNRVDLADC